MSLGLGAPGNSALEAPRGSKIKVGALLLAGMASGVGSSDGRSLLNFVTLKWQFGFGPGTAKRSGKS